MKLIALPDLHDTGIKYLPLISEQLADADYIVLVGDLTNAGRRADAERVIQTVQSFNSSILAVSGNWDRQEVDTYLTDIGVNLHRKHRIIDGLAFIGVGGALLFTGQTPTEFTETMFQAYLTEATTGLDPQIPTILISHQPPFNTRNDTAWSDLHVGSHSIRTFIEHTQPMLCLTGHIHEGIGIDTLGTTQIVNPGPLWQGGYAFIELTSTGILTSQIRQCSIDKI